jgi:hypothetical protein
MSKRIVNYTYYVLPNIRAICVTCQENKSYYADDNVILYGWMIMMASSQITECFVRNVIIQPDNSIHVIIPDRRQHICYHPAM